MGRPALLEHAGPALPRWLDELLSDAPSSPIAVRSGNLTGSFRRRGGLSSTQVCISGVEELDILTFQQSVADAYRAIFDQLQREGIHPIRFWAFIPRLHADYGSGLDRYMAFNAGRFAAYSSWLGGSEAFSRSVPTGSAVGSASGAMALCCLASDSPGMPVENPRQVPAYRYSRRFGPLPPCFARATRVERGNEPPLLFVGGTASIRGEESMHAGSVELQTLETFRNLASVACSGLKRACPSEASTEAEESAFLQLFRELRIYHPIPEHRQSIVARVSEHFPGLRRIEAIPAELCRPELLVEIEGIAESPAGN